jgi:hypothetical protein
MTKACFKCRAEKPLDAFYRHPMMRDGHLGKCIECAKADVLANRRANIERYRAYDRERATRPERRASTQRVTQNWRARHPARSSAHCRVNSAVRRGDMQRPSACEWCGRSGKVEGHHHDYTKPLDVIWLCKPCHYRADELRRKAS